MEKRLRDVLAYMPENIKEMLFYAFETSGEGIEEIRLRCNLPLMIGTKDGSFSILPSGKISKSPEKAYIVNDIDIERVFCAVCENSVYAFSEEIRQGFVTIRGGHRVGISGRASTNIRGIETFRDISSLNIRIAREVIGAADFMVNDVLTPNGIKNTLIVAPPMGGKTTVLRDLARQISSRGKKTAIADERGEIAALFKGAAQNDVGPMTDVLENVPKAEALVMLLRTMSPEVIITDEISTRKDAEAIEECFGLGVKVIASTHGETKDEVLDRDFLKPLIGGMGFGQIVVLKREKERLFGEIVVMGG